MSVDTVKVNEGEEVVKINEANGNEEKNEEIEQGSDEEALDEDEFEVDCILDVAAMDGEVKYQVRWKGYGSDEDSWEPEWNLETARLILDEYISNHQDKVKKAQDLVSNAKNQRKRRGRQTKMQNKGKKKARRSTSSEHAETTKTPNIRTRRKVVLDKLESDYGNETEDNNDSDEDYDKVSKKRSSRHRAANAKREVSKNNQTKPLIKDLSPRNAKNAWLYDDAEDSDSDASEGSGKAKKSDVFLRKGKKNNESREDAVIKKNSVSHVMVEGQCENSSTKVVNGKKRKNRGSPAKVDVLEENYESKVKFIGVVQCKDGAIKVVYTEKDETSPRVVSVKEAFEIDGFGLVQYFISRCEFGEPQSNL